MNKIQLSIGSIDYFCSSISDLMNKVIFDSIGYKSIYFYVDDSIYCSVGISINNSVCIPINSSTRRKI